MYIIIYVLSGIYTKKYTFWTHFAHILDKLRVTAGWCSASTLVAPRTLEIVQGASGMVAVQYPRTWAVLGAL